MKVTDGEVRLSSVAVSDHVFNPRDTEQEGDQEPSPSADLILDPNSLEPHHVMSQEIRAAEANYFSKMTGARVFTFGRDVAET